MPNFEKTEGQLPGNLQWGVLHPNSDWIDMPFVLQAVEDELRSDVLAAGLETLANVHRSIAEGATKIANIIRGGQQGG